MFIASGPDTRSSLSIKELPRSERPRERLQHLGARSLSVPELLSIVVGSGAGGRSALGVGQEILARSGGSLRRIAAECRDRRAAKPALVQLGMPGALNAFTPESLLAPANRRWARATGQY